jgi:hypothetical protein
MAQTVEYLSSKHKTLSSNHGITKKKKRAALCHFVKGLITSTNLASAQNPDL